MRILLRYLLMVMTIGIAAHLQAAKVIIKNSGFLFDKEKVEITVGDTVVFQLSGAHNAIEVSKATWDNNGNTSNSGFKTPLGGGTVVMSKEGTFYYVCEPHAHASMKGTITVKAKTVSTATKVVIRNSGFSFDKATTDITLGDTILFQLANSHNALEVSKATWDANGNTSNGGFRTAFGGGTVLLTKEGTYYYVCEPHAGGGMKGQINVKAKTVSSVGLEYQAFLSSYQEPGTVVSNATGDVKAVLDGKSLVITGSFKNLIGDFTGAPAGGAHVHRGYAGQNGGIQLNLTIVPDGDKKGGKLEAAANTFTLTDDQLALLQSRQLYVNIHTSTYAGGEIRGQLLPKSSNFYQTNLYGSQEVPAVLSNGSGAVMLEVDGDTLRVSGSFQALGANYTASHLHNALAGTNGGIVFGLSPTLATDNRGGVFEAAKNKFALSSAQKTLLEQRRIYANVHSSAFTGGEIRGQVHREVTSLFWANLSGENEVPNITTAGRGAVLAEIKNDSMYLSGSFILEGDFNAAVAGGAHIHLGMAGQNGAIAAPINVTLGTDSKSGSILVANNRIPMNNVALLTLALRRYYVNIHSTLHASGEIRGQMVAAAQYYMQGNLSGSQESTPIVSNAGGGVMAELNGNTMVVHGSFAGLEGDFAANVAGGAHIHFGLIGSNGPIIFPLSATVATGNRAGEFLPTQNFFTMSTGKKDTLAQRCYYVNIHTAKATSGEVRGQLVHQAYQYFMASLSGGSETVPVGSRGRGMVIAEVSGNRTYVTGSFSTLTGDVNEAIAGGAHIHFGNAGLNGGILYNLKPSIAPSKKAADLFFADNTLRTSVNFLDTLRQRAAYVNIHSTTNASGEIRGQLLPMARAYFTTFLSGVNEIPNPALSTGRGHLKYELSGTRLVVTGAFSNLVGNFNPSIAGGAHLHFGRVGANGSIATNLNATVLPDNKTGGFLATNNTIPLTGPQIDSLVAGRMYANIHTSTNAGGEIRGQVFPEFNFLPSASTVLAPVNDTRVRIEGSDRQSITIRWNRVTDQQTPMYIWQGGADANVATPLVSINTGRDTSLTLTYGQISALLQANGFKAGETALLYHRAVASDGSLFSGSPVITAQLTLGVVTGLFDEKLQNLDWKTMPNPAVGSTTLSVKYDESAKARWNLLDYTGRVLRTGEFNLQKGETLESIPLNNIPASTYFVQLWIDGKPAPAKALMVKE
jgi:plastocyanin